MRKFLYDFYTGCWPMTIPVTVGLIMCGSLFRMGFYVAATRAVELGLLVGVVLSIVYLLWGDDESS